MVSVHLGKFDSGKLCNSGKNNVFGALNFYFYFFSRHRSWKYADSVLSFYIHNKSHVCQSHWLIYSAAVTGDEEINNKKKKVKLNFWLMFFVTRINLFQVVSQDWFCSVENVQKHLFKLIRAVHGDDESSVKSREPQYVWIQYQKSLKTSTMPICCIKAAQVPTDI